MAIYEDYTDEFPIVGDEPPGGAELLHQPVLNLFNHEAALRSSMLPEGYGVGTRLNRNDTVIPVENISLSVSQSAKTEYIAHITKEVAGHKKEIAATTLTVAGLLLVIDRMHAHKKTKNG